MNSENLQPTEHQEDATLENLSEQEAPVIEQAPEPEQEQAPEPEQVQPAQPKDIYSLVGNPYYFTLLYASTNLSISKSLFLASV